MRSLKYLAGYPEDLQARVHQLIEQDRLGTILADKYGQAHAVRNDRQLYEYTLQMKDRSRLISGDVFKWFERTNTRPTTAGEIGAELVFLDPPYRFLTDRPDELLQLALHLTHAHLSPGATVVFRHDVKNRLDLPNLERYDAREYGDMAIELLRYAGAPPA